MDHWRMILTREIIREAILFVLGVAAIAVIIPLAAVFDGWRQRER
jgi:hypothetical protein